MLAHVVLWQATPESRLGLRIRKEVGEATVGSGHRLPLPHVLDSQVNRTKDQELTTLQHPSRPGA